MQGALKPTEDWLPFPFSNEQTVQGELAFVGYGISAPENGYDDYGDFEVEGKILLMLRYEPSSDDEDAPFGGARSTRHAFFNTKASAAAARGAKGILIVNPPSRNPDEDALYGLRGGGRDYGIAMAHIKRDVAERLLQAARMPKLAEVEKQLNESLKPMSRDMGMSVKLNPGLTWNKLDARNVLALLPGDGSCDEYVVVGAHRDHLGNVPRQFQRDETEPMIHNGADDNATGTAALLELARALADGPKLRRHILFIAFDAEEMGLLGARHYGREPTVPFDKIKAMINFDMIGRFNQDSYTIYCVGSGKEFAELVKRTSEAREISYNAPPGAPGNSDHAPFVQNKVPSMFAHTGLHPQYHQPEDDWELIDGEGAAKLLGQWHEIITEIANMKDGPTWQETSNETRRRVRIGIMPDWDDEGEGLLVESVVINGVAALGGMQDGDRLVKLGEVEIQSFRDFRRAMGEIEFGDEVKAVVKRGEKRVELELQFPE